MLLPCRRFSSALHRPLNPGSYMALKNGNGPKIAPRRYCTNKTDLAKKQEASPSTATKEHSVGIGIADKFHHPTPGEKRILVWTRVYPNMESIPKTVSQQSILRAKDMMRVYITAGIFVFSTVIAIVILMMSRKARDQGDSLTRRRLEWKKALQEQGRKEREEAAKKAQEGDAK